MKKLLGIGRSFGQEWDNDQFWGTSYTDFKYDGKIFFSFDTYGGDTYDDGEYHSAKYSEDCKTILISQKQPGGAKNEFEFNVKDLL